MGSTNEVRENEGRKPRGPMTVPTKKELYAKVAELEAEVARLTAALGSINTAGPHKAASAYDEQYPPFKSSATEKRG